MKVMLNGKQRDVEPGTKMITLVKLLENTVKDDPMIKSLKKKTGKSKLLFVLNNQVIQPEEYADIEINEGDQIRMIHPFFGG